MNCSSCGKSGFVSVGNKRYCSNCGVAVDAAPRAMSDIRPGSTVVAPQPTVAPPRAANQLHGRQVGSGPTLDLRAPQAAPTTPPPAEETTPAPVAAEPAPTEAPAPNPINAPAPAKLQLNPNRTATRLESAAAIPKSTMVQKFPAKPTPEPAASAILPNSVATQVEVLGDKAAKLEPRAEALQSALAAAKPSKLNPTSMLAGIAIVGIMGGYIWMQNYPKMAFHSAASKAGFEATMPSYVPSSYRQNGPVSFKAGELTISFNSPSIESPLNITQRRTDWDSNSLKENYVAQQTDNYTAIQGQGLTIYLFNKNQASWVNHGVWYTISGADNLNREQILKIAYGL